MAVGSRVIEVKESCLGKVLPVHQQVPEFEGDDRLINAPARLANSHLILLGLADGVPAGYMIGYDRWQDGSFYCWMTGVIPQYRGFGLLTAMMAHLETWAKENGYRRVEIKTRNERREMLAFLVKYGFNLCRYEPDQGVSQSRLSFRKEI